MMILLSIAYMRIRELFSLSYFSVVYCILILTTLLSRDHVYSKELDIYNKNVIDCAVLSTFAIKVNNHLCASLKTLKTYKEISVFFTLFYMSRLDDNNK